MNDTSEQLELWLSKLDRQQLENVAYEAISWLIETEELCYHPEDEDLPQGPYWDSCGIVIGESENDCSKTFNEIDKWEKEISENNSRILSEIGENASSDFYKLLDGTCCDDKIEIVDEPYGDDQNESCGIFTSIFVDQWSVGDSGDSFEGFIYGKFADNKWLKIPYYC